MRLPVIFICFTIVLDAMGIGLIMPVMPELIQQVGGIDLSKAAMWGGVLTAVFAVNQFLFGALLGSLSDAYGRRKVLLISLFVMALDYLVMALAGAMWLLVLGRLVGGITSATQSTAGAFMADISKPEEKAKNFGLIGAAFGVGFILGPLVGGLLSDYGARAPFYAAAVLAALNFAFGFFVLPETVTDRIRRKFDWRRANPFVALFHVKKLPGMGLLLLVTFLMNLAFFVYPSVWAYYGTAQHGWDGRMIGISLAIFGFFSAVVQGGLMGPTIRRFGERNVILIGISIDLISFLWLAVAWETWQVLGTTPIAALASMTVPALQGMMSRRVPDNAQGELQGVNTGLQALATIISPLIMTQTFGYFTAADAPVYFPGAPFILSAALMVVALVVMLSHRKS
jgi:DHA1 family tetracycline resistance protein-like MFS transporter